MRRGHTLLFGTLVCCAALTRALSAAAQTPATLDPARVAFPGGFAAPASAASAAAALADRRLGEEPYANPAVPRGVALAGSPMVQRMSRQDLRSLNRSFDERAGFLNLASAWAGAPLGPVQWSAYVYQPLLRNEDNSYLLGRGLGGGPSAAIASETTTREIREGLAASCGAGPLRIGVAGEWTHRSDFYDYTEVSGSPDQGHRRLSFSGGGFGGQIGARLSTGPNRHRIEIGASARRVPALSLTGTEVRELLTDSSTTAVAVKRASGWEAGASARVQVSETFRATLGLGGHGAQDWKEFGLTAGSGMEWKLAGEFHDPEVPWVVRFGFGAEQQRGVEEARAAVFALGLGWTFQQAQLDFGLMHRTLSRTDLPHSFDDRLVATVSLR
jgi:hypothetical protein